MLPVINCVQFVKASVFSLVFITLSGHAVFAQQVILSEDFESDTPGTFPGSADFFAKSSILNLNADFDNDKDVDGNDFLIWQRGFGTGATKADGDANASGTVDDVDLDILEGEFGSGDPANIVVTGGTFADPFSPGNNQSMVLHNPNTTSQMAVSWADEFDDDPNTFRNGSIEFDLWMESPDPEAFWTFLGVRIGHGDETRNGVSATPDDTTVWNSFRMQNQGEPPDPVQVLEQVSDPGHRITFGPEPTYTDDNSTPDAGAMGPDQLMHVRFEFAANGYSFSELPTYRLIVNGTQIEWTGTAFGDPMEHPWVLAPGPALAPGINVISFFTDASAFNADQDPGIGNVYIDNLVITNDDLPPLSSATSVSVPEPSSCVIALSMVVLCLSRRRRITRQSVSVN
ncbi:MAG: hypothetical protein ABGX16_23020 [Pirellulales bacterium]